MEKKKCPQCKNLILITSPTCLYCGRPNKFITKEYVNKKWSKDNNKNIILKTSPTCLYCGRPNKFITKSYVNKKWNKDNSKDVFDYIFINKYLVSSLLLIFTIVIIIFS